MCAAVRAALFEIAGIRKVPMTERPSFSLKVKLLDKSDRQVRNLFSVCKNLKSLQPASGQMRLGRPLFFFSFLVSALPLLGLPTKSAC